MGGSERPDEVTLLLAKWRGGSPEAEERLMALVYGELRKLAASYLRSERAGHTLEPTAVVNEAFLRLVPQRVVRWENRAHFFGIAARMMRRILVDHARRKRANKRAGFAGDPVSLSQVPDPAGGRDVDVLALHEARSDLAELDPRQADIVELRYFGGLKIEEVAAATGVSMATVKRELTTATAWLRHRTHNNERESRRTMPKEPPRCNTDTVVFWYKKAARG
jgi:RNA polymerase sigma factor (TIGR02999 family)